MQTQTASRIRAAFIVIAAAMVLAGCAGQRNSGITRVRLSDRECLARAMYFESNRSSDAGMLAVGTVVMNRVKSGRYGSTVCEVVGAPRQFAPGVLTRSMTDSGAPRARRIADAVLAGRRHPGVQNAQFFHTAGYKFPYNNMRYVLVAGGNAFYDKTKAPKTWWGGEGRWGPPPAPTERIDGGPIMVANVEVHDDRRQDDRRQVAMATPAPVPVAARRGYSGGADARMNEPAPPHGVVAGIPTYEPQPGSRPARAPREEIRVASLEPSRRPGVEVYDPAPRRAQAVREDNGLREEDRWRDQELAEENGKRAAESDADWGERRETRVANVESAPLPVIEPRPSARSERPVRTVSRTPDYDAPRGRDDYGAAAEARYEPAPAPVRETRVASRTPRTIERSRPVAADPAASGWQVGAQPVRAEREDADMGGYSPLSNAATDAGYDVGAEQRRPAKRAAARPSRSYDGVDLQGGDQVQYGYR